MSNSLTEVAVEPLRINAADLSGFRPSFKSTSRSNSSSGESRRDFWEDTIRENAERIMKYIGNVAVSAGETLDALNALEQNKFKVRKANGIGDAMGILGLNLPIIEGCSRKLYLLLPLMMEAEEFEALAADTQALARYIVEKNKTLNVEAGSRRPEPIAGQSDTEAEAA